ncbi:MAG: hypothetical protein KDA84_16275 [Planctomycetaceae bacterium]|nr:hypothetical protein [Planctomycetaceae bacterium]
MAKKYLVTLNEEERVQLQSLISTGKSTAQKLNRARILLQADTADAGGGRIDQEIVVAIRVGL